MTKADESVPRIDFSKISFPSDGLTIKTVREVSAEAYGANRLDWDLFHPQYASQRFADNTDLLDLMRLERELAKNAFVAALDGFKPRRIGRQDLDKAGRRRGITDNLHVAYKEFGLSHGRRKVPC